jgi:hypothetical protein
MRLQLVAAVAVLATINAAHTETVGPVSELHMTRFGGALWITRLDLWRHAVSRCFVALPRIRDVYSVQYLGVSRTHSYS